MLVSSWGRAGQAASPRGVVWARGTSPSCAPCPVVVVRLEHGRAARSRWTTADPQDTTHTLAFAFEEAARSGPDPCYTRVPLTSHFSLCSRSP